MQGGLLNSWTVIASSVEAAFGWSDSDLQLIQSWIYVSYLVIMLPFTWLMDRKGNPPLVSLSLSECFSFFIKNQSIYFVKCIKFKLLLPSILKSHLSLRCTSYSVDLYWCQEH